MADIAIGVSEYDTLKGKTQTADWRAGLQLLALLAFIAPMLPKDYRITVNEGRRSKEDQTKFWNAYQRFVKYGKPWAAVAAFPFTSKHNDGLAFDLGGPGGSVISDFAHALLVKYGPKFGIHWTGKGFGEKWHFEYVPGTALIVASDKPATPIKEENMNYIKQLLLIATPVSKRPGLVDWWLTNPAEFTFIHMQTDTQLNFWRTKGVEVQEGPQPPHVMAGFRALDGSSGPR
jgi:hypothetical protein